MSSVICQSEAVAEAALTSLQQAEAFWSSKQQTPQSAVLQSEVLQLIRKLIEAIKQFLSGNTASLNIASLLVAPSATEAAAFEKRSPAMATFYVTGERLSCLPAAPATSSGGAGGGFDDMPPPSLALSTASTASAATAKTLDLEKSTASAATTKTLDLEKSTASAKF